MRSRRVTLVTHNTAGFSRVAGLLIENWRTARVSNLSFTMPFTPKALINRTPDYVPTSTGVDNSRNR